MNTRKEVRADIGTGLRVILLASVPTLALVVLVDTARGGDTDPLLRVPNLQRMKVFETKSYAFDFADIRGITGRSFVRVNNMTQVHSEATVRFYLFGRDLGVILPKVLPPVAIPLQWTVSRRMIFVAWESRGDPARAPRLLQYPIRALVIGTEGIGHVDDSKFDQSRRLPLLDGKIARLDYTILAPIARVRMGFDGWKEGDGLIADGLRVSRTGIPVIHYDIRALDDVRVELYMTVNDKLSRWLFDGDKWTLSKNYSVTINGPFLVCKEGNTIVAEKDGHWCIIESLDKKNPEIRQIVKRVPDEPLVLVEDLVAGRNYFQQQGKLYDENAAVMWSMPVGLEGNARFKAVVDFVCSRREK